jgi:conjugal transfer pilus assembly protein TraK
MAVFVSGHALAAQEVDFSDETKTYQVNFSRNDITRLAIGNGRITAIHCPSGRLTIEKDDDQGYAILRARDDKPVSCFVNTAQNHAISLYLTPVDMPPETIVIKEKPATVVKQVLPGKEIIGKAEPVAGSVKKLILAMARNERETRDYTVEVVNQVINLWQETSFQLVDKYVGAKMIGYRFRLKNTSNNTIRLGEQEFYKIGVVAVSIDSHVLVPAADTYIYVVMVNTNG